MRESLGVRQLGKVMAGAGLAVAVMLVPVAAFAGTMDDAVVGAPSEPSPQPSSAQTPSPQPTPTGLTCVPPLCRETPSPTPTPTHSRLPSHAPSESAHPVPTPSGSSVSSAPTGNVVLPPAAGAGETVSPVQSFGIGDAAPGQVGAKVSAPKQTTESSGSGHDPLTVALVSAIGIAALLGLGGGVGLYLTRGPHPKHGGHA